MSVLLAAAALVWTRVNGPVEGPTLISFTPDHGFTVADIPSAVALVAAGWLFLTAHRHRRRPAGAAPADRHQSGRRTG